jgi:hypothetical protein
VSGAAQDAGLTQAAGSDSSSSESNEAQSNEPGDGAVDGAVDDSLDAPSEASSDTASAPEGDATAAPGEAVCPPWPGGNPSLCAGVDTLVLSNPEISSIDGGAFAGGAVGLLTIVLSDPDGGAYVDYPRVCFAAQTPGVSLGLNNPAWALYAIKPGVEAHYYIDVHFAPSLPSGTVVHFAAQPSAARGNCPGGRILRWDLTL